MADLNVQLILRLVDRATAPARAAMRAIERIGGEGLMRQARQVEAGARMMGRGLGEVRSAALTGSAVVLGYAGAVAGLAGSFLGPAAEMERFSVQLRNLEGGAEGADRAMRWITDFAARTPLELNQTVSAYARLRAFGLDPTNGSLQALVDTMAASGQGAEQLDGLVLALGQAWTKGKLQGEEALQMLERGVPVWDLLAQKTGKNAAQLQEMATKGKLGRKELMLLIEAIGERNKGASDAMAKTWDGILSKMSDFWYQFRVMVMNSGVFDYLKTRLNEIFGYFDAMAQDGRLQAIADRVARHMLTALDGIWRFALGVRDARQQLYPILAAVAEQLGGWDRLGWIAAALVMRGTLFQLIGGFGRLGLGAGQAALGILSMLGPLNIVRTAALAWMATGIGAAIAGIALAGVWIWRNWSGLAVFFGELWSAFREALGPAAPMLDGIVARLSRLRAWVLRITGPIDESGEEWRRWGRLVGTAIGQTVRAISDWTAAHPGLARALGYTIAALGAMRLLLTPVTGARRVFSAVARGLGTAVGIAGRAIMGLGRVALVTGRMMLANPILAVIAAIAGAAYLIYRNWDTVGPWFRRLWDSVRAIFSGFMEFVAGIFTGDLGRAFDGLKQIGDGLLAYYRTLWDGVVGVFTWAWENGIAPVLDALGLLDPVIAAWEAFKVAIGVVLDWISEKFSALMTVIQPVLDGLKWVQDKGAAVFNSMNGSRDGPISSGPYTGGATGPILPPGAVPGVTVPARALGGPVRAGQIYRWQEEGHELFVPRSDGQVISNRQLRAMQAMAEAPTSLRIVQATPRSAAAGGASGRHMRLDLGGITINAAPGMDPRAVARAVRREIEALTRERGFALHDGGDYA
ncbi:MAG: tape measure protein [Paracoccus aminovorans]|nr:tape measure protein [Paracoccus aminovorans]